MNAHGERCVKTTAPMGLPGIHFRTITHDHAHIVGMKMASGGICNNHQDLCFALALWNGNDPILKERLFGLTGSEGNHGEDVKEYYFYLDSTPTHSYMKFLYKYPQRAYPYSELVSCERSAWKAGARIRTARHRCL